MLLTGFLVIIIIFLVIIFRISITTTDIIIINVILIVITMNKSNGIIISANYACYNTYIAVTLRYDDKDY